MAYIPDSGSVVAFQSDPTKLQVTASVSGNVNNANIGSVAAVIIGGSIAASFTPPANQSVSGTVGASLIGYPNINVGGSVVAFVNGTVPVNTAGSVVAFVSGTVPVNAAGSVVAFPGTNPWPVVNVGSVISTNIGSIITTQIGSVITTFKDSSLIAVITSKPSISGTVAVTEQGTWISSIVNTVPSSVLVGTSIFGQLPAGSAPLGSVAALQGTLPWAIAGSVAATVTNNPTFLQLAGSTMAVSATVNTGNSSVMLLNGANSIGSVTALQGTNPWIQTFSNSSILAVPTGSTITIQQANSIVGTYAEDAASASADKGVFVLGVRNDTVASLVSADLDYGAFVNDSAGRQIIKPFASEDGTIISYVGSIVSGSVQLIQDSVIGKKTYITDFILSNTGAATTLVTFQGGDTSLVGQYIAPTGGGLVATGLSLPLKNNASQSLNFKVSPSTSVLYLTVKGFVAP